MSDLKFDWFGITDLTDLLQTYFESEKPRQFKFEKTVGKGAYGIAYRLIHTPRTPSGGKGTSYRLVLKADREGGNPGEGGSGDSGGGGAGGAGGLTHESMYLSILQWAKHIVKLIQPPNDPLTRQFEGVEPHGLRPGGWIYIEWLENGTVGSFTDRAYARGRQLPNRMLWRFFLCFVRIAIAMAWPPPGPGDDGGQQLEFIRPGPARRIVHDDLHDENVMFGSFEPDDDDDDEHTLTPIIKAIDFGLAKEYPGHDRNFLNKGPPDNLFDIGVLMSGLATLDRQSSLGLMPRSAGAEQYSPGGGAPGFLVAAKFMIPDEDPNNTLDPQLRHLIISCTAINPTDRPTLEDLIDPIVDMMNERDEAWYRSHNMNARNESDNNIDNMIQELILDA